MNTAKDNIRKLFVLNFLLLFFAFSSHCNELIKANWVQERAELQAQLATILQRDYTAEKLAPKAMEYLRDTVLKQFCSNSETQEILNNLSAELFFATDPRIEASNVLKEVTQQGLAIAPNALGLKNETELIEHFQKIHTICKVKDKVSVQSVSNIEYTGTLANISEGSIRLSRTQIYRRDMLLHSRALFWKEDNALYIKKLIEDEKQKNEKKIIPFCKNYISSNLGKKLLFAGYLPRVWGNNSDELSHLKSWVTRKEWLPLYVNMQHKLYEKSYFENANYTYYSKQWMPIKLVEILEIEKRKNFILANRGKVFDVPGNTEQEINEHLQHEGYMIGIVNALNYLLPRSGLINGAYIDSDTVNLRAVTASPIEWNFPASGSQSCTLPGCTYTWGGDVKYGAVDLILFVKRGIVNNTEVILYSVEEATASPF